MSVTTWIGIAFMIRVQILRYRDLNTTLPARTLGTPTLKIVAKNIMPQLVSVIVTTMTSNVSKLYLIRSLLVILRSWITNYSAKFGSFDFGLFSKRNNQCLLVLDSIDNSCLGILIPFVVGQNLADASDPRTHR